MVRDQRLWHGLQWKRWGWLHSPCLSPRPPPRFPLSPPPLLSLPLFSSPPLVFLSSPAPLPLPGLSVDLRQQVWQKPRLSRKTRGLKAHKFHAVQHANVPSADKRAFNPAALLLSTLLPLSLFSLCHSTSLSHSLVLLFSFFSSLYLFFYVYCVTLYCVDPLLYTISPCLLFSILLPALFLLNPKVHPSLPPQPAPPWRPLLLLIGPCALWSSWRCLSMAATDPTWHRLHLAPTWPGNWRSTPRCPSIMQASMLKCSGSACLLQRCPPAKLHPKPSKVREACWFLLRSSGWDVVCRLRLPFYIHDWLFFY